MRFIHNLVSISSGFRGADPSLPIQRAPLCTFLKYPYLVTDPKIVLKAPLVPIYSNFKGGARAKRTQFFG